MVTLKDNIFQLEEGNTYVVRFLPNINEPIKSKHHIQYGTAEHPDMSTYLTYARIDNIVGVLKFSRTVLKYIDAFSRGGYVEDKDGNFIDVVDNFDRDDMIDKYNDYVRECLDDDTIKERDICSLEDYFTVYEFPRAVVFDMKHNYALEIKVSLFGETKFKRFDCKFVQDNSHIIWDGNEESKHKIYDLYKGVPSLDETEMLYKEYLVNTGMTVDAEELKKFKVSYFSRRFAK